MHHEPNFIIAGGFRGLLTAPKQILYKAPPAREENKLDC